MEYSIQLYSCRDAMKENVEDTLSKIAKIGYTYVETAGFFGYTAVDFKALLDNYGLKVSGTHTSFQALDDESFDATVKFHKTIGTKNVIIPAFKYDESKEQLDDFIRFVNRVQPKLEAEGMKLAYHNHSGEFLPTAYGSLVHKEIEERTNIDFEIDTYWVYNANVDPIATLDRLKDRVHFIHIKDGFLGGEGKPLGKGTAPVAEVYSKAKELGIQMVVESETQMPDGITEAQICFNYLNSLEK